MNPPCPLLPLVNLLPCRFACRNKHIFILFPRCNAEFKPSGRISWGRPHPPTSTLHHWQDKDKIIYLFYLTTGKAYGLIILTQSAASVFKESTHASKRD